MTRKDIRATYEYLGHSPVEVRVINPKRGVLADKLVSSELELMRLCERWDGSGNIYVGLNERRKDLVVGNEGAKKADIVAVWTIPIDIDPIRIPASKEDLKELQKQPSTDAELECAIEAGQAVRMWFRERKFYVPPMAMSGNGTVLWRAIPRYELTSDEVRETWEQKLRAFLIEVASAIPEKLRDKVKIDTNIYDVTRILKVVGTTSVKGTPTEERPHRVSHWIDNPMRLEDAGLLEYILDIDVSSPASKPQAIRATQIPSESSQAIVSPKLSDTQKNTLKMALRHPYVVMARQRMNPSDVSESDWAFLKELSKEGIYAPDILTYALMTEKDTKFFRDGKGSYLIRTIENFVKGLPGISLEMGKRQLEREFDQVDIGSRTIIVCGADVGLGKTYCAKEKTIVAVLNGINVLVVVSSHTLATEWESLELPDKIKNIHEKYDVPLIVHLYGVTHENVECPYRVIGMRLLGMGHSKLFKAKYCHGICDKRGECLHLASVAQAKDAPILIAQHEHSHIHQTFFQLRQIGNDRRMLVIIDEQAQFVHAVRLKRKDLHGNMILYRTIAAEKIKTYEDVYYYDFLADRLEDMLTALDNRQGLSLPSRFFAISSTDANKLDVEIAQYYMNIKRTPKVRNLLWDLCYILEHKPSLQYDRDNDCLLYRWHPNFGNRTVLILSGTTRREYIEKQLGEKIDGSIAEDWNIRRENLKVVQLLVGMGGRNRLLKQVTSSTFTKQHGRLFMNILYKHKEKRIALITSLGENALGVDADGTAKGKILRALYPTAKRHDKKLVSVSNDMLQKNLIPDGISEIPLFHFGMKGIDCLNGRFDVVWELNGHYYHPIALKMAVFDKFDLDISGAEPNREKVPFVTADPKQSFETTRYVYDDPTVELELEHTQTADVIQTEGRFLREEQVYKVIYRTHNVNIPPYPTRVYRSWQALFKYEFAPYVPPEAWLTGKAAEVWEWIQDNVADVEFTADDVAQGMGMSVQNVAQRYLKHFLSMGRIKIVDDGGKGRGHATVYKTARNVDID
jgi:hypothetical protein